MAVPSFKAIYFAVMKTQATTSQTVKLTLEAKTPNCSAVIRSFNCESVESAILKFRKEKKLWLALGAFEVKGNYSFEEKTFSI